MLGGRLAQAGADVTFLVRRARLREQGLRIDSPFGDARIDVKTLTRADAEGGFDLVLLTCKAYDLPSAIDSIAPAIGRETAVLPLLNGIAHIDTLNQRFGRERVIGGTVRMQATLTPDGVVRQLNDWQTVTFGEQDGSDSARTRELKAWSRWAGRACRDGLTRGTSMGNCTQDNHRGRRVQIETNAEADPYLDRELKSKGLPPLAFFDNSDGLAATEVRVVAVKRGVLGCHAVDTEATADELNARHRVTPAQREAMRFGSMFGWGSRLATPQAWEGEGH